MQWSISKKNDVVADMRIRYRTTADWEQWGLLTADRHIDNEHSNHELQHHHLKQAIERDAFVVDVGDYLDAMQGKQDKRSAKSALRVDNKSSNYLNNLVDYAVEFFAPYKDNLALIAEGNHESAVTNRYEYSLHDGVLRDLSRIGSPVVKGGYRGYIRFLFEHDAGGKRMSRTGYYFHGSGGGGPVTKGVIQTNRRSIYLPDADFVFSGHIHESWLFPITRSRVLASGEEITDTQYHVQLPTYKEEFIGKSGGWHHETGKPPKPLGAWWIRFYYSHRTGRVEMEFRMADK